MSLRGPSLLGVGLLCVAAALRLAQINCSLWLDEIWSIRLSQLAGGVGGVFILHHDNNHWLNTLVMYFLGPGRAWWEYHVLAELSGIATVLLGWLASRRSFCVLLLLATSEFLIEYSSDARGYAPAGFFAVLCLWLLQCHLAKPRRMTAALLCAATVLGLLSHLTFIVILAGLMAAAVAGLAPRRGRWAAAVARTLLWFAVPVTIILALYLVDVRKIVVGGGPPTPSDLASQAAAMYLGIPLGWWGAGALGACAWLICAIQLWRMYRGAEPGWPLFLAVLLFVPAFLFFWPKSDYIHPRYAFVAVPFLLILLGRELGHWLSGPGWMRAAALTVLAALSLSNMALYWRFFRLGRGDYVGALAYMIDHTAGPRVVVGTQSRPTATFMVLEYYNQYHVHSQKPIAVLDVAPWGGEWPQWLISEEDLGEFTVSDSGAGFVRRAEFPKGAVTSGIPWTIYESQSGRPNARADHLYPLAH